jgi:acyl-CoA synthetase (AMP-forming)/AMP-acid ligase II/thioesterase domain-containing protein/acyl carrier protein
MTLLSGSPLLTKIQQAAVRAPAAAALAAPGRPSLSYAALLDHVRTARGDLQKAGADLGALTVVALPQGPEFLSAVVALMNGSACAPLDLSLTEQECQSLFARLRPAALVFEAGSPDSSAVRAARNLGIGLIALSVPHGAPAGVFRVSDAVCRAGHLEVRRTSAALIHPTSATTGQSKLVPRTHAMVLATAEHNIAALDLTASDCYLNVLPLCHAAGLNCALSQLACGGAVFCAPGFQAGPLLSWMRESEATWTYVSPGSLRAILLALENVDIPALQALRLRFIRTGGAPSDEELRNSIEKRFGIPVLDGYGLTEAPGVARNSLTQRRAGSVGRSAGPEIAIRDSGGALLPPGTAGEVVLRGPTVMLSYLDDPEATRAAFADGWFRTGDFGYLDADGFLFLSGRGKEMINRGAKKILPQEIDEALARHPAVADAAAFAIPHRSWGEEAAACVVLRPGAQVSSRELRAFCAERLANFKVPRHLMFADAIPRGSFGKPKRLELAQRWHEEKAARTGAPPRAPSEIESRLIAIWKSVLNVDNISVEDDFFDLGGDSLSATILLSRVLDAFARSQQEDLQTEFFEQPTVARMAELLTALAQAPAAPPLPNPLLILRKPDGRVPFFLFCNEMGEAYQLRHLAEHLPDGLPFIVLCPPPAVKNNRLRALETLAAESLETLRAFRNRGPYLLGAFCGAAPLAFEVALQLVSQGEPVPFLALFDAPAPGYPKIGSHWKNYLTQAGRLLRGSSHFTWRDLKNHAARVAFLATRRARAKLARVRVSSADPNASAGTVEIKAPSWEYQLRPFPVRIVHFLSAENHVSTQVLSDPRYGWADFATAGIEYRHLPVDHLGLLRARHAALFAAEISGLLGAQQMRPQSASAGS